MHYFEFKSKKYPIKLTYGRAINLFPQKFGINLTRLFTDEEECQATMSALVLDDEKTLGLMWFFVEESQQYIGNYDDFLNDIEDGKILDQFREEFWQAVANFSGPLKANLMKQVWKEFKQNLKAAEFQIQNSTVSSSDSNPGE